MKLSRKANQLIKAAIAKDFRENPELMREAGNRGNLRALIKADVHSALRDNPSNPVFPTLRSAVSKLAAQGMSDIDPNTGIMTFGSNSPATAPAASTGGDDWLKMITSVVSSAAQAGSAIFTSKIAAESAEKQASLLTKLQSSLFGAPKPAGSVPVAGASMMGGMMPMLLIGGVAAAGIAFFATRGGKSRRRRR